VTDKSSVGDAYAVPVPPGRGVPAPLRLLPGVRARAGDILPLPVSPYWRLKVTVSYSFLLKPKLLPLFSFPNHVAWSEPGLLGSSCAASLGQRTTG
jgi:hypothetical protein